MKKHFLLLSVLMLVFVLFGCAAEPEPEASATPAATESDAVVVSTSPTIGLIFAQENAFSQTVEAEAKKLAAAAGYEILSYYSDSDGQQVTDVYAAIGAGAQCILIAPRNMDNLGSVIDECNLQKIPVINLMVPLNGKVNMLVCPDYQLMGSKGADSVKAAVGEENTAEVYLLESVSDSFVAQLKHDGFAAEAAELTGINIAGAGTISPTADAAYAELTEQLPYLTDVNAVFASNENFAPGVLRAVQESGRDIKIVCVGGGSEIMDLVAAGSIYSSVFVSPYELAKTAMEHAVKCASDPNYVAPQYAGMTVETIFSTDVEKYKAFGTYADVLTANVVKTASPSPEASTSASPDVQATKSAEDTGTGETASEDTAGAAETASGNN